MVEGFEAILRVGPADERGAEVAVGTQCEIGLNAQRRIQGPAGILGRDESRHRENATHLTRIDHHIVPPGQFRGDEKAACRVLKQERIAGNGDLRILRGDFVAAGSERKCRH
jgi:hypothetical protein